jgi:thiamine-phosphate pyrophosphorylase
VTSRLAGIDPALYVITDTALCARAGRSVAETVAAAVRGGAGIVQVRDKAINDAAFYELSVAVLKAVKEASGGRRVPVVLNDRVEIAARLLAEGLEVHVHVGQDDMPPDQVRERLGPKPLIGLSITNQTELLATRAHPCVDLLGIGPVFATATKPDAARPLGARRLAELVDQTDIPAVAIGGIDVARAGELHTTGVVGICVVSAICQAADPEASARALYQAFKAGGT